MILPWHTFQWQMLVDRRQKNRMPHALLLYGKTGLAKKKFAETLAHTMLCQKAEQFACGQCHACHLLQAGYHPDFKIITPEESAQMIKVDQIREVVAFVNETAQQGGYRVVIIHPATAMNSNAANALLKSLEEPTPRVLIILIAEQHLRIPATISSRCQKILFSPPSEQVGLAWIAEQCPDYQGDPKLLLNLSDGAPLRAVEMVQNTSLTFRKDFYQGLIALAQDKADPLQLAATWQEQNPQLILNLLFSWTNDLLRLQSSLNKVRIINIDYEEQLTKIHSRIPTSTLLDYVDLLQKKYAYLQAALNLNKHLLLEELLIYWVKYVSG